MKLKIVDGKLLVKVPYSPDAVSFIKQTPGARRFSRAKQCWILDLSADNLQYLMDNGYGTPETIKALDRITAPLRVPGKKWSYIFNFKTKPYIHQEHGFDLAVANDQLFLDWEMGTGKTWVAINAIKYKIQAGLVSRALVVCPCSVVSTWVSEFEKHSNITPTVIGGTPKKRIEALAKGQVCIVNYELLIWIQDDILKQDFEMLVLDESHYIKNMKAQRTKVIHTLASQVKYRMLMTGTKITNGAEDIFSQFLALDDGATFGTSFYSFRNRYFIDKGYGFPDWQIKAGSLDEIKKKIYLKADRVGKRDCFDLPPKNYQWYDVEMSKEQARIYREIEKKMFTVINDIDLPIQYLITKLMKLNQVTSGFVYRTDDLTEVRETLRFKHNKLKALRELIEDKPKAVVWCQFTEDIEAIKKEFPEMNPVGTKEWFRFQSSPTPRLLVGQVHSGGIGITLTACQFVVYYSQGYSLTDRMQSEDRTHRIGTTGVVTYVDLVCPGTIDVEILDILKQKRQTAKHLTGDLAAELVAKLRGRGRK